MPLTFRLRLGLAALSSASYHSRCCTNRRALASIVLLGIALAEVGQRAFEAFDVEPQRPAMGEQQERTASGGFPGMKLDSQEIKPCLRRPEIDIARLARQHAVEPQRRDQAARRGLPRQRLLPVQPGHADHQPLFALPPDDVRCLHPCILHMRGYHREILGIECDQFELGIHR